MDHGKSNVVFASSSTRNGGGGGSIGSVGGRGGTFSQMVRLVNIHQHLFLPMVCSN